MNKTKIEWTDYSFNPITGCLHDCWYCYAKRMFHRFGRSFEPTFYPERLKEKLSKYKITESLIKARIKKGWKKEDLRSPIKIFVCSVADLFALWTKPEWTQAVLDEIQKPEYNHLTFQLLTKQPQCIKDFDLKPKKNIWIGVTITKQSELTKMKALVNNYGGLKFLSFEPLLENIDIVNGWMEEISWIIVGKLTGSKKVKLENWWVDGLINVSRVEKIPIFIKDNIKWPEKIQEFPKYATRKKRKK